MWCRTKPVPSAIKLANTTLQQSSEMSITVSTNSPDGTSRSAPLSRFLKNGGRFGKSNYARPFSLEGREIDIEIVDDNDPEDVETEAVVCEIDEFDEEYDEDLPYNISSPEEDYVYKPNTQVSKLLKKYGSELSRGNGLMTYRCEICTKTFDHKRYLTSHMVSHTTDANFVCNICSRGFKRKQELRRHYDGIHAKKRPFKCNYCFSEFQLRYGLTRHLQTGCPKAKKRKVDEPAEPIVPELKSQSQPSQPAPVTPKVSAQAPKIVPIVPQGLNLLQLIQKAASGGLKDIGSDASNGIQNQAKVDMTPKTLAVDNGQGSVLLINLVPVPSSAPLTPTVVTSVSAVANVAAPMAVKAEKTETSVFKTIPTPVVGNGIKTSTVIIANTKPTSVPPPAAQVGRQESAPASVIVMKDSAKSVIVKQERGQQPVTSDDVDVNYESYHTCNTCGKKFMTNEKLEQHDAICGIQLQKVQKFFKAPKPQEESHKCDLCLKTFYDNQYLQMHYPTCPGLQNKGSSQTASEFQCDICLKFFTRKSDLKRHGLVHTKARPFVCNICGQSFQFNYVLYRHYLFCHPEEAAQQDNQEMLQAQAAEVRDAKFKR